MGNIYPSNRSRIIAIGCMAIAPSAYSQAVLDRGALQLTTEAYANITSAAASGTDVRFDGGARVLGRIRFDDGPDIGIRVAIEEADGKVRLAESSVLLFGGSGRLEIGERMGLPDVLTGYAPNNFQFTSAEFGPASGPSLDPAGRLQTAFLSAALAAQLGPLIALGGTAALFDDQSTRLLYVSPKKNGWLAGISYAPDADDRSIEQLYQAGVTHESYWQQNVLRWGVTYASGHASRAGAAAGDLDSVGAGISITFDDALTLGLSASYDDRRRAGRGGIASVNYNTGPWPIGAYYQYASSEDRLCAFEAGASYRFTTKARLYGAWYRFDFNDDDRSTSGLSETGDVFMLGLRFTL